MTTSGWPSRHWSMLIDRSVSLGIPMRPLFQARKPFHAAALLAEAAALCLLSSASIAAVVDSGPVSIAIPDNIDGLYFNVVTGASGATGGAVAGWDLNPYTAIAGQFHLWGATANTWYNPQGVANGIYNLPPGTVIQGATSAFFRPGSGTNVGAQVTLNSDQNFLGFMFTNEANGNAIHFGYLQVQFGATPSTRSIVRYFYENVANTAITIPGGSVAPNIAYNPATGSAVNFTGVTTVGSTGNGSISATPSGGSGTGAGATTTINGCALSGADAANFGGAAAINLSFFGTTTTAQNLSLTCTSGAAVRNATLTCNETRGAAPAVTRSWPLTCPAGGAGNVPPAISYTPTTGTTVNFTGVTTVGTTGSANIAATPSGGSGSGAAATTTINGCALTGANPGAFGSVAGVNLSFVGSANAAQNIPLSCTSAAAAQTATLSCIESSGGAPGVSRSWPLNCPAGTVAAVAPTVAYAPTTGSNLSFSGVTSVGTTGTASIVATPSGGSGSGAAATTTVNGCTLGGANPGAFASVAGVNLSFVGSTTTPQTIGLGCTSALTAQTATLSCNETQGAGAAVARSWSLSCPAGTLQPLTSAPAGGSTINLPATLLGSTSTLSLQFTNPNPAGVAVTCTLAPTTPFSVTPGTFTVPANGSISTVISLQSTTPSSYAATLTCTAAGGQTLVYNLTGAVVSGLAVPVNDPRSLLMLALLTLAIGLVSVRVRR